MTLFVLQVHGNYYGTSKRAVEDVHRDGGKICILDIDVQGVKNVNTLARSETAARHGRLGDGDSDGINSGTLETVRGATARDAAGGQ